MKNNFSPALARVLVYEGGKADNPKDPGGRTAYGITQRTYNSWLRLNNYAKADVFNITKDQVAVIYKTQYWDRILGDSLPTGMEFAVFDGAVNSGCGTSIMWLQSALGVPADGSIGPKTLDAALSGDDETVIDLYLQYRLGSLKRLTTWGTFGKGWSARISNVRKIADAWAEANASTNVGPAPVLVSDIGGHTKANIEDVKSNTVAVVTAHVVTVGGAVSTGATQIATALTGVTDTFQWAKYVLGGVTLAGAIAGVVVMFGKQANDAAINGTAKAIVDPNADSTATSVTVTDDAFATPTAVIEAHIATGTTKPA